MTSPLREIRGLRLFFPLALGWSVVSLPLWLLQYVGVLPSAPHFSGAAWHGHEMVFGYLAAAVAGFLTVGDRGPQVLALAVLWLAGRIVLVSDTPGWLAAGVDLAFLPLLIGARRPKLWSGAKVMTLGIALVLVLLSALNLWAHLAPDPTRAVETASLAVLTLVVLVGGRLVPGHTRAATRRGPGLSLARTERAGFVLCAVLVASVAADLAPVVALSAGALAVLQLYRLSQWWDRDVLADPLLWGMHIGFAWLALGLLGYAAGVAGWLPAVDALHLALVGSIGSLTLTILMRLMRAQAGEAQKGGAPEAAILLLVTLAALLRAGLPLVSGDWRVVGAIAGGIAWSLASALALVLYAHRLKGRQPGGTSFPPG